MADGNGKIITPNGPRPIGRRGDYITRQEAYDLVIQECAKVHEHYLTQIPKFIATMIQDALMSYALIPTPEVPKAPARDGLGLGIEGELKACSEESDPTDTGANQT